MMKKFMVLAVVTALSGAWLLADDGDERKNSAAAPRTTVKGKPTSQPWSKRPPGEGPFGGGGHSMRMPPEQEKQALDFLKANRPEQYDQLIKLRDSNSERYARTLRMISHWMEAMEDMPENVKKATFARQDAQIDIVDLVQQIHATADPAVKADLTAKLRIAVNKQLDAEQIVREHRLSLLHKQVLQMQEELQKSREQRAQFVEEQMQMYLKSPQPRTPGDRSDRTDRPDKPPFLKRSGSGGSDSSGGGLGGGATGGPPRRK